MNNALSAWVVCSPGDPTERQWRAMRELSGDDPYTAERYNERSGWVIVAVWRGETEDRYSVAPNGRDVRFLGTTS